MIILHCNIYHARTTKLTWSKIHILNIVVLDVIAWTLKNDFLRVVEENLHESQCKGRVQGQNVTNKKVNRNISMKFKYENK